MSTATTHIKTENNKPVLSGRRRVPALRFKEFEGDWNENRLNDIAEFKKGKGISKADITDDGELECIRYGELYTTYSELIQEIVSKTNLPAKDLILSEYNDVIIPASGESNIDIATASCVLKSGVAFSGDLNIIRSKMNGIFLSFYLNNKRKFDIARLAQGVSVVHLYSSQLKTLKLNLPSLPEQQKIASFLSAVDDKVQQLNKKKTLLEHYKKGVMQQLFSGQLRFKDEDGNDYPDWEDTLLGDCLKYVQPTKYLVSSTDYDNSFETPVLTAGKTFVLGYTDEKENICTDYPLIIFDDFTTASKYVDFPFKAKSSAMKLLLAKEGVDVKFMFEAMQNIKFEVGGHGRHWISIFSQFVVSVPSINEQQKIATYLSGIDTKIEAVNTQITQTQTFKKGLLQQLFV